MVYGHTPSVVPPCVLFQFCATIALREAFWVASVCPRGFICTGTWSKLWPQSTVDVPFGPIPAAASNNEARLSMFCVVGGGGCRCCSFCHGRSGGQCPLLLSYIHPPPQFRGPSLKR